MIAWNNSNCPDENINTKSPLIKRFMNEQHIETIHLYLTGAMDALERQAFEAAMQADPALREEVELERILLNAIEQSGTHSEALKTIQAVQEKLRAEGFFKSEKAADTPVFHISHTKKFNIMKRLIAVAATLVVVAGGIWFFMNQDKPVDNNALFAQFYQPKEDVQRAKNILESLESYGLAGVQTDTDTLKIALELYETDKYDEALALLKGFAETHPENDVAQYYIGVIHMSQGRYAKAIEVLLPISRSEESALKNDALWNLGLCYLKTDDGVGDAREAFIKLSNDNTYSNHRGAKAVLEQLLPQK